MPNINDVFPRRFLHHAELNGLGIKLTILRVTFEAIGRPAEMKAIVHFEGTPKQLPLNKTNAKTITKIVGTSITEQWVGQDIVVYPTTTEYAGETVDCIRVRAPQQPQLVTELA